MIRKLVVLIRKNRRWHLFDTNMFGVHLILMRSGWNEVAYEVITLIDKAHTHTEGMLKNSVVSGF